MTAALRHLLRRTTHAAQAAGWHVVAAAISAHHRLLVRLGEAIDAGATVRIRYTDQHGTVSVRDISPRTLRATTAGDITVRAWDHRDGDEANFRTDRMTIAAEEAAVTDSIARTRVTTDDVDVTVSTIRIADDYYDTVILDEHEDRRDHGKKLGTFIIGESSIRSANNDDGIRVHAATVNMARTRRPIVPTFPGGGF